MKRQLQTTDDLESLPSKKQDVSDTINEPDDADGKITSSKNDNADPSRRADQKQPLEQGESDRQEAPPRSNSNLDDGVASKTPEKKPKDVPVATTEPTEPQAPPETKRSTNPLFAGSFGSFGKTGGTFSGFGAFGAKSSPLGDAKANPWAEPETNSGQSKANPWAEKTPEQNDTENKDGLDEKTPEESSHDKYAVVSLEKQETKTGEEAEQTLFKARAKLYALNLKNTLDGWKERGIGTLHLNSDETAEKSRLLMRTDTLMKVILNITLSKTIEIHKGFQSSAHAAKFVRITSPENSELLQFAFRLQTAELADEFYNHLNDLLKAE